MAQHLRLPGQNQEGFGTACNVLRIQICCGIPVQGKTEAEEKVNHSKYILRVFSSYSKFNCSIYLNRATQASQVRLRLKLFVTKF